MIQSIVNIALVVKDYDEAIDFYTKKLHFELIEDTYQLEQDKRWVVISPPGSSAYPLTLNLKKMDFNKFYSENITFQFYYPLKYI